MIHECKFAPIEQPKYIRSSQREQSEKVLKSSRPPRGVQAELLYIRFVEMFHVEDFGQLRDPQADVAALEQEIDAHV
jgi:hypothetical protein